VNRIIVLSVFAFFYGMATLLRAVERASFQYDHLGVARIVGSECERVKKIRPGTHKLLLDTTPTTTEPWSK
jgi:hypothetical protein